MDDKKHPVLVLAPDGDDARCLCDMIDSAADDFDLRVSRLDSASTVSAHVAAEKPDAILLDAQLETDADVQTVTDVCHAVKGVPVVLITPTTDRARHHQALSGGAADCLIKWEFDPPSLARTLAGAIGRKNYNTELRTDAAPR